MLLAKFTLPVKYHILAFDQMYGGSSCRFNNVTKVGLERHSVKDFKPRLERTPEPEQVFCHIKLKKFNRQPHMPQNRGQSGRGFDFIIGMFTDELCRSTTPDYLDTCAEKTKISSQMPVQQGGNLCPYYGRKNIPEAVNQNNDGRYVASVMLAMKVRTTIFRSYSDTLPFTGPVRITCAASTERSD